MPPGKWIGLWAGMVCKALSWCANRKFLLCASHCSDKDAAQAGGVGDFTDDGSLGGPP